MKKKKVLVFDYLLQNKDTFYILSLKITYILCKRIALQTIKLYQLLALNKRYFL